MSALVLGGGGLTGIAWETGVLHGLACAGLELRPTLVVGTSAGATVGAQLLSGTPLADLYAAQLSPAHHELTPQLDLERLIAIYAELGDVAPDEAALRRVGVLARGTETVPVEVRQAVVASRLPSHDWPSVPLQVTAVDVDSGELVVLSSQSGVSLVDAVTASCAVPGVWPPVPLAGRTLMDGGARSLTNMDLAAGHDEVVVLAPMAVRLEQEVAALRSSGSRVRVLTAGDLGPDPFDPAARSAAAEAGYRRGLAGLPS